MSDDEIIDSIFEREKGYVDNPADGGGPTNFGVTLETLAHYRGLPVSADDMRALTMGEARQIYREEYLHGPRIDLITNEALRMVVLDAAVNHGPRTAIRMLQRALRVKDDGVIGDVTLAALPHLDQRRVAIFALAERAEFYGRLVSHDLTDRDKDGVPDNTEFDSGWMNRLGGLMRGVA